jgi:hypothetical protein
MIRPRIAEPAEHLMLRPVVDVAPVGPADSVAVRPRAVAATALVAALLLAVLRLLNHDLDPSQFTRFGENMTERGRWTAATPPRSSCSASC